MRAMRYSDRTWVYFAADFKSEVRILRKFHAACEALNDQIKSDTWGTASGHIIIRDMSRGIVFDLTPTRIFCQALTASAWEDSGDLIIRALVSAGETYGTGLRRIGFRTQT